MFEVKEKVTEVKEEEIVISGKLFDLFREWVKSTKLSPQKLRILCAARDDWVSYESLVSDLKLSAPLICYHVNGNLKGEGLRGAGFLYHKSERGRSFVKVSEFGIFVLDMMGYKSS